MKTNISGVANNLAIGRGATINSDTSSLVRIQDDPLNYTYAKVEADTTITNTIENPIFFARSNAIYTDVPLYIGDAIYFQGNEQVLATIGSMDSSTTAVKTLSLDLTDVDLSNLYQVMLYMSDYGNLYVVTSADNIATLVLYLNEFFKRNGHNLTASYTGNTFTITSTAQNLMMLELQGLNSMGTMEITSINEDTPEETKALEFDVPLYNAHLVGNSIADTPPDGDNSNRIATTAFVHNALVGGVEYKGTFDASAGNYNALADSEVGDMYYVNKAGTINGIDWQIGDYLLVNADGATNVTKIDNTESSDIVRLNATQTLTNKTLTSPSLTGTPTAPTASAGTNTTQVATTAFVTNAVNSLSSEIAGDFVNRTSAQTVGGAKTFTSSLVVGPNANQGVTLSTGGNLEFRPATTATNGGFIDFHYAGSTTDYTSRIIEDASGRLTLSATNGVTISNHINNRVIARGNSPVYYQVKSNNISLASPPSADTQLGYINFMDSANVDTAYLESRIVPGGISRIHLYSTNTSNNTCGLRIDLTNGQSTGTVSLVNANIPQTDNSTKIATTAFVSNYSFPIQTISQTSGTVNLTTNKVYRMNLSGTTTFSIARPSNTGIYNQIKVMLNVTTVSTINWGTSYFYNGTAPDVSATGQYAIYYDWDAPSSRWVCGGMSVATAS